MWQKKKYLVVSLILAAVLVAGTIGGVALAQTSGATDSSGATLLARVAAILGIDQETVEDAFSQAQREMQAEVLDARLKALVEEGNLTQEQADQYKSWWQTMPDMPAGFGMPGLGGHRGMRGFGGRIPSTTTTTDQATSTAVTW